MVHVGVDLDKRSSQIAVLTDDGEIVQQRLANDAVRLTNFFSQLPPQTPIAIEASGTWWWLVDLLEQLGHQPVLSNPKQTKAIAAARLKNDRVDAERRRASPSSPASWRRSGWPAAVGQLESSCRILEITDNGGQLRARRTPGEPFGVATKRVSPCRFVPSRWHWSCTFGISADRISGG